MSFTHQAKTYLKHWLLATGRHSLHEPYIFDLYDHVISESDSVHDFNSIELLRKSFSADTKIPLPTFGADSRQGERSLKQIAQNGSTTPQIARILSRLIAYKNFSHILELGTSLGLTSLYLSENPAVRLTTMEADPTLTALALDHFRKFDRKNITLVRGNIDDTLETALEHMKCADMVYMDANHRFEPTVRYFEKILEYTNDDSIIILDDIHWSEEMSRAWEVIRTHDAVTMSIDFHRMGWVFFQPFRNNYHYRIELPGIWS